MPYSVDWIARVITVPTSEMTSLGGADYELVADGMWRELRRLEWEPTEGLWAPEILEHTDSETLAGITYAPRNKIVNDYKIVFDPAAEKVFLKGDNNNLADVFVFNGVSVIPSNSAGNIVTLVENVDSTKLDELHRLAGLDASNPVTATPTDVTAGDIVVDIVGDPETTQTATRQP